MSADLHTAIVTTGRATGWALVTPQLARRPVGELVAYVSVVRDRDGRVDRHNWWVAHNGRLVVADACTDPADAIEAADTAVLVLLRNTASRKAAVR
jgi:hypothetical protein